jgi:hypothetical protein
VEGQTLTSWHVPLQPKFVEFALPNAAPTPVLMLPQLAQLPLVTAIPLNVAPVQTGARGVPPQVTVPTGAALFLSVWSMA